MLNLFPRVFNQIASVLKNFPLFGKVQARLAEIAAENELLLKENLHLARALDGIGESVVVTDVSGAFRFVNATFEDMFGYASEEVQGKYASNVIVPRDLENQAVAEKISQGFLNDSIGNGWQGEVRRMRKTGEEIDVLLTVTPVRDDNGTLVGRIGVSRDITASKQAERALKESEERFRAVVELSPEAILVSIGGKISYANPEAANLFGTEAADALVGILPWNFVHSDDRSVAMQRFGSVLADDTKLPAQELRIVTPDGQIKQIESMAKKISYAGRPAVLAVLRDITQRKQTEARLQETARLASIGELAAGVAHEVNNPLASILGFAQLMLYEGPPEPFKSDLNTVYSEAQRAAKIVQNLMFFARKGGTEKQWVNVNSILTRAIELKFYDLAANGIKLTQVLALDIPNSMIDEHQLVQVFVNILNNAQQAIQETGQKGQIVIRSAASEGAIALSISDDGPGIRSQHMGRIFEPFFTTKVVGIGTGLGLSICYGIIREHGGELWAETKDGGGTTFHIELPIVTRDDEEGKEHPPLDPRGPSPNHILAVDDGPETRNLLRSNLGSRRCEVDLAEGFIPAILGDPRRSL